MDLSFKSIVNQSITTFKSNIKEVFILSSIITYLLYLYLHPDPITRYIKNAPTGAFVLFLFFVIIPVLIATLLLLLPIIIINKESGRDTSYIKMIQYVLSRLFFVFFTNILYGLIVFAGSFLIIPGWIWYFSYSQANLFSLIDGMGPIQSLKLSKIATKKSKRKLFNLLALIGLVFGLPLYILNLVLTLITLPELMILSAYISIISIYFYLVVNYTIWKTLRREMINRY